MMCLRSVNKTQNTQDMNYTDVDQMLTSMSITRILQKYNYVYESETKIQPRRSSVIY